MTKKRIGVVKTLINDLTFRMTQHTSAEVTVGYLSNRPQVSIVYLTNRFHVAVRLFSNRSQMTSKCEKNEKVAHEAIAVCH